MLLDETISEGVRGEPFVRNERDLLTDSFGIPGSRRISALRAPRTRWLRPSPGTERSHNGDRASDLLLLPAQPEGLPEAFAPPRGRQQREVTLPNLTIVGV
ncbi:unnamed protein product [Lampetra planeri]